MKGRDCKYTHPEVCTKFTQHGTHQPKGCKLGKACKDFHPKMCIHSLRKGVLHESSRFNHVKGTKRHPPVVKNDIKRQNVQDNPTSTQTPTAEEGNKDDNGNFLEVIRLLKAEILQTFDQKMESITNQISILQSQQMKMTMPVPMSYTMQPPQNMMTRPQTPMFMLPNQQFTQSRVMDPAQQ